MVQMKNLERFIASPSTQMEKGKRKRRGEEEEHQGGRRRLEALNVIFKVFFDSRISTYESLLKIYNRKKVVKGKIFAFKLFGEEGGGWSLPIVRWLKYQGWEELMGYQDLVYPKLVQISLKNYNPHNMKTWIRKVEIDLSPAKIRDVFELEEVVEEVEWPKSKNKLFSKLVRVNIGEKEVYLHSKYLDLDLKLAHNVMYNNIFPRIGSRDQMLEKDAKVLLALKNEKKLDFGRLMFEHLKVVKQNSKYPLPYRMLLIRFLRIYNIDVREEHGEQVKLIDIMNKSIEKGMGFKFIVDEWIPKNIQSRRREGEEEEMEEEVVE